MTDRRHRSGGVCDTGGMYADLLHRVAALTALAAVVFLAGCSIRRQAADADRAFVSAGDEDIFLGAMPGRPDSPEPRSAPPEIARIPAASLFAMGAEPASRHDLPEERSRLPAGLPSAGPARAASPSLPESVADRPLGPDRIDVTHLPKGGLSSAAVVTIEPDCELQITVEEDPGLNGNYRVDGDGGIDFGYVGLVILQSATQAEAEGKIKRILEKRYFRTASVSVRLTKASYDKIQVSGAVANPGLVKIGSGSSILLREALIRAGGLLPQPGPVLVKVVPGGMRDVWGAASPKGEVVSLSVREGTVEIPEIELRNNDLIHVFSSKTGATPGLGMREVIVLGEVRQPGVVRFAPNERCTLLHLLFKIGGVSTFARDRSVKIIRTDENGEEREIRANAKALMQSGDPEDDVPLEHGDRIIVPTKKISFF
ncbi:MAG: SLBB domain-containing protein [Kiritimatiellae bacterium]|nr:SLBB domain-containing protein [Kiritimatiellia bacterium]